VRPGTKFILPLIIVKLDEKGRKGLFSRPEIFERALKLGTTNY
jgi:hypothetical protein